MNLSPNFTLEEMTASEAAARKGLKNIPSEAEIENGKALCVHVLEKLREKLGKPIIVNSGYRCKEVNKAIGGASKSQHIEFKAADIRVHGCSTEELFQFCKRHLEYDQCIQEFDSWVHISWNGINNRNQDLRAVKEGGKTAYVGG